MISRTLRNGLLLTVAAIACIGIWFVPAIPQDPAYHHFADTRPWLGIANFGDVMSNLPFVWVGLIGLVWLNRKGMATIIAPLKIHYLIFFVGVALVSLGSGYYHLNPTNETLLWDRLPMTLAFMSLFSILIAERVSLHIGRRLLWPLMLTGLFSVLYWHITEQQGHGDLRLYALVQFLPILLIPMMLWLYPSSYNDTYSLLALLACYLAAKLTEFFDPEIFEALGFISGHTIKHLFAALGVYCYYRGLRNRQHVTKQPSHSSHGERLHS